MIPSFVQWNESRSSSEIEAYFIEKLTKSNYDRVLNEFKMSRIDLPHTDKELTKYIFESLFEIRKNSIDAPTKKWIGLLLSHLCGNWLDEFKVNHNFSNMEITMIPFLSAIEAKLNNRIYDDIKKIEFDYKNCHHYKLNNNNHTQELLPKLICSVIMYDIDLDNDDRTDNIDSIGLTAYYNNRENLIHYLIYRFCELIHVDCDPFTPDDYDDNYDFSLLSNSESLCDCGHCRQLFEQCVDESDRSIKFEILESQIKEKRCSICTEQYNNDDKIIITSCGHLFHITCINQWKYHKTICPICRRDLK